MRPHVERPADLSMMAIIHDAFRRDLRRLERLVDEQQAGPGAADLDAGRALWQFLLRQLDHHHSSEDERLWPLVRAQLVEPSERALLDEMSREHAALEDAIEQVTSALRPASSRPKDVARAVQRFRVRLENHLDHEERDAVPLVEAHLTQADLAAFERHQKKRMGLRGAAVFFPWLLDGLDEPRRVAVLQQLHGPLRYLAQNSWERRYRDQSRRWRRAG